MGRGRTWDACVPWLRSYGHVYTYDAPFHRGADTGSETDAAVATEYFVDDIAQQLATMGEPAVLIGHSMGGLHAWCVAACHPNSVKAVVVEDMCPDYRGRTTQPWDAWFNSWPTEFSDAGEVYDLFGPVAGEYFLHSFDKTEHGWRLHGHINTWRNIAQHWGTRDYWKQWSSTSAPALLLEGEHTLTIPGQMKQMASIERGAPTYYHKVQGAAHLIHDEAPAQFRGAVEAFLDGLSSDDLGSDDLDDATRRL
ncbi:alpha/beta hydrolase [Hoyosella rhizosphaerae]|nr:alpha/beta hydrolase [Hoyosella rhizosphaerae]